MIPAPSADSCATRHAPSALHFAIVLLISALSVAPKLTVSVKAALIGLGALTGFGNSIWACIGMLRRRLGVGLAHWSDFWLYGAAPTTIYSGLVGTSVAIWAGVGWACAAMSVLLLALLLLGIRNAWDLVTWMAPGRGSGGSGSGSGSEAN